MVDRATTRLIGDDHYDDIWGGEGNDLLYGSGGRDSLYGDDGNDALFGGASHDRLYGGDGEDWLSGGYLSFNRFYTSTTKWTDITDGATDRLYGEGDSDTFIKGDKRAPYVWWDRPEDNDWRDQVWSYGWLFNDGPEIVVPNLMDTFGHVS